MLYDNTPPRPSEYGNGITTEYRGFTISDRFEVSCGSKVLWECMGLQQAKNSIDSSIAMKAKQDLGSLWKRFVSGECELENGSEARERDSERVNEYFENQLNPE